jgi:UDPglucose 6-dehydrogenase
MVGAGYVGLVSAASFANAGHLVVCIDTDSNRIANLVRGIMPIYEPGLEEIVSSNCEQGRLRFSDDFAEVRSAEAVFLAVGTPARRGDGHADLSQIYAATSAIVPCLNDGTLVVVKSTVPVGTCDEVEIIISQHRPDLEFDVVSNPEFLRAGAAISDFVAPDRVVIGTDDEAARQRMAEIYQPVLIQPTTILYTNRRTSELIKYAANTFLATKISFINEVANLCERVGADVGDVSRGMGLDARIGSMFLRAGPGFGGSCFPKDTLALIKMGEDHEAPMRIAETVLAANDARKRAMARKVAAAVGGSLRGKIVAQLGLTFKAETDDVRESPAVALAAGLADLHAQLRVYDPAGMKHANSVLPAGAVCCSSEYDAAEGADAIVIATEWKQFRALDFGRLKRLMRAPLLIDLRDLYRIEDLAPQGFRYCRLGAPQLVAESPLSLSQWTPVQPRCGHRNGIKLRSTRAHRPKPRKRLVLERGTNSA